LGFPRQIKDIPKLEKLNNLAINLFGYSHENNIECFYPLYISKNEDTPNLIELLYIESEDIDNQYKKKSHYALIRNFSRLIRSTINSQDNFEIICRKCMIGFTNESAYNKHLYYCTTSNTQCVMPEEGKDDIVEFKNHANAHRHPLIIAADFETLLIDINQKISKTSQEIKKKQHLISSASFCSVGAINEFKLFRGENCLDHFIKSIEELINNYNSIIQKYPKIQITKEEACKHYHQTKCWICDSEFNNKVVMSKKR